MMTLAPSCLCVPTTLLWRQLSMEAALFRLISITFREMGTVALVAYLIDKMREHD